MKGCKMKAFRAAVALWTALALATGASAEESKSATPVIPQFGEMDRDERDKASTELLASRRKLISGLVRQLRSGVEGREHIIDVLGHYRARIATEDLLKIIDFKAKVRDREGRIPRWSMYPARDALSKIGRTAALRIHQLLPTEDDELRRSLMCTVLRGVDGREVSEFILEKLLHEEKQPDRRRRIEWALEYFKAIKEKQASFPELPGSFPGHNTLFAAPMLGGRRRGRPGSLLRGGAELPGTQYSITRRNSD